MKFITWILGLKKRGYEVITIEEIIIKYRYYYPISYAKAYQEYEKSK